MAGVQWPPDLVKFMLRQAFRRKPDDPILRTNVSTGPKKQRARYTNPTITYGVTLWYPREQLLEFDVFYKDVLLWGAITFNYDNPLTRIEEEFRMVGQPDTAFVGWDELAVAMTWEQLPGYAP